MNGWESRRHSARHAFGVALRKPSKAFKILIDTCILYVASSIVYCYIS